MAIANENDDGVGVTNAIDVSFSHTVSSAAPNRYLLAQCMPPSATEATAISSLRYNSIDLVVLDELLNIRFSKDLHVRDLVNPSTGANALEAIFPAAADQAVLQCWSATGVDQADAWEDWQPQNGPGTSPVVTVTSRPGDVVVGGLGLCNSGITVTPGTDLTVFEDDEVSNNGTYRVLMARKAGAASVTFDFGLSSSINYGLWAISVRAAAGGYTLVADAGAYSLTGSDVGIRSGRRLVAEAASYALAGQEVGLRFGARLIAESGPYSLIGQNVGLRSSRRILVEGGAYALSGQDVTLKKGFGLAADPGSYLWTGQSVGLLNGRRFIAETGSYLWAGQPVSFILTVFAAAGAYVLTGFPVTLLHGRRLVAEPGSYVWTGNDVGLAHVTGYLLAAEPGSYSLDGQDVALKLGRRIPHEGGSYLLTGSAVGLLAHRRLVAEAASYGLTGQDALLVYATPNDIGVVPLSHVIRQPARRRVTSSPGRS